MTLCRMAVSRIVFVVILLIFSASCASMGGGEKKKAENLKGAVEAFNQDFRWEDYKSAGVWIPLAKKEQFWTVVDKFKGKIRIFDYQIREVNLDEKSMKGTAVIFFQYYRMSSPTLETVTTSQKWYFSEKEGWRLGKSGLQALTKEELDL
ncbi:MAG: hypothetical protein LLG06_03135 [Desulfobacteraceae bacterium]|nr:hypothetical protein [Desulfobacteraceae bacterium]